jgi:hypothetical protein
MQPRVLVFPNAWSRQAVSRHPALSLIREFIWQQRAKILYAAQRDMTTAPVVTQFSFLQVNTQVSH